MATTSPDGIFSADGNTPASLELITGAMAQSVQDALDRRAGPFSGTTVERNAFTNAADEGVIWVDTNGEKGVYRKNGANWQKIFPVDIPTPNLIAAEGGTQLVTPAGKNLTTSVPVTFTPGKFSSAPFIQLTPVSSSPQRVDISFNARTKDGFTIYMFRDSSVATSIHWIAMEFS